MGTALSDALLGESTDPTDYDALLREMQRTMAGAGITRFNEFEEDAAADMSMWQGILPVIDDPSVCIDLDTWKFKTDPSDVGLGQGWHTPGYNDSSWDDARADLGVGWEGQGYAGYTGIGWYRTRFALPADFSEPVFLMIALFGVDGELDVYVNGNYGFLHKGMPWTDMTQEDIGVSPFGYNIKAHLNAGEENLIAVRVHSTTDRGGIWKPVFIVPGSVPGL